MPDYDIIKIDPHEQVVLVTIQPTRLDAMIAAELENEVSRAALDTPDLPIVLDMSNVKFAPSVVLGALVNLFKGLRMSGRKLFVIGVNRQIRGTLSVTRLDALMNIRRALDDALADL